MLFTLDRFSYFFFWFLFVADFGFSSGGHFEVYFGYFLVVALRVFGT